MILIFAHWRSLSTSVILRGEQQTWQYVPRDSRRGHNYHSELRAEANADTYIHWQNLKALLKMNSLWRFPALWQKVVFTTVHSGLILALKNIYHKAWNKIITILT